MITGTWLHDSISDHEVVPPNYSLIRKDWGTRGGGVAAAIKQGIVYEPLSDVANAEYVSCRLNFFGTWLTLDTLYRKPGATDEDLRELYGFLLSQNNTRSKIVLREDFNLPNINWSEISSCARNPTADLLFEMSFGLNLVQTVTEPAPVTENSCALLDLLFLRSYLNNYTVTVHDGISDHKLIYLQCDLAFIENNAPTVTCFIDFTRANDVSVLDYLEECLDSFETEKKFK